MKKYILLSLALCGTLFTSALCGAEKPVPRVSILGDSYSTFRGWIPRGNAIYYPRLTHNDVSKVEQCWWSIVIKAIGGKLEKNESWSGSTICYTGYRGSNASASSFVKRADRLGNPTLILICGGTNDSWAGSPIGDYMWNSWDEKDLFEFRPAMAKMLHDIKKLYPQARVFFILNSELKPAINDSVHKICEYYNVTCIDLKNVDKQSGHPSVKGMQTFADQVVKAIQK